jgi:hypothetical protein
LKIQTLFKWNWDICLFLAGKMGFHALGLGFRTATQTNGICALGHWDLVKIWLGNGNRIIGTAFQYPQPILSSPEAEAKLGKTILNSLHFDFTNIYAPHMIKQFLLINIICVTNCTVRVTGPLYNSMSKQCCNNTSVSCKTTSRDVDG